MAPSPHPPRAAGFTLIEVMIALLIVATGSLGAILALLHAQDALHEGQVRQSKMLLIDAKAQRLKLLDKTLIQSGKAGMEPVAQPEVLPGLKTRAAGSGSWSLDPTPAAAGSSAELVADLGGGAYFRVDGSGTIHYDTTVAANTPCASVPAKVFCREILVTQGLPVTVGTVSAGGTSLGDNTALLAGTAKPFTVWTRVTEGGNLTQAVVGWQVVVQ
jgi:prepilin-type N-terminal cleavage/methylation domain-containing protein